MLKLLRSTDPEMGQKLYSLGCMLHARADSMITEPRRLSWMDGSDGDDEDQHSRRSVPEEAESQLKPVPVLVIL